MIVYWNRRSDPSVVMLAMIQSRQPMIQIYFMIEVCRRPTNRSSKVVLDQRDWLICFMGKGSIIKLLAISISWSNSQGLLVIKINISIILDGKMLANLISLLSFRTRAKARTKVRIVVSFSGFMAIFNMDGTRKMEKTSWSKNSRSLRKVMTRSDGAVQSTISRKSRVSRKVCNVCKRSSKVSRFWLTIRRRSRSINS